MGSSARTPLCARRDVAASSVRHRPRGGGARGCARWRRASAAAQPRGWPSLRVRQLQAPPLSPPGPPDLRRPLLEPSAQPGHQWPPSRRRGVSSLNGCATRRAARRRLRPAAARRVRARALPACARAAANGAAALLGARGASQLQMLRASSGAATTAAGSPGQAAAPRGSARLRPPARRRWRRSAHCAGQRGQAHGVRRQQRRRQRRRQQRRQQGAEGGAVRARPGAGGVPRRRGRGAQGGPQLSSASAAEARDAAAECKRSWRARWAWTPRASPSWPPRTPACWAHPLPPSRGAWSRWRACLAAARRLWPRA